MRLSKWQALGNVYLLHEEISLTPEQVREHVGHADGIVELSVREGDGAAAEVVVWNRDGSRAELSGNATRIAAQSLFDRFGRDDVILHVGPRTVRARRRSNGDVEQEMGPVRVEERELVDGIEVVPVDVGNPHAVVVGDPASVTEVGPRLEAHPRFPNRTNVQVARIDSPGVVSARVWERGVGETPASGTSAVAVAAATHGEGEVVVRFPGGDLTVRLRDGRAWLEGPPATRAD